MSKLPQKIEEKFDREFKYFSGHEMLQTHQGHDIVKSFIATILDEESMKFVQEVEDVRSQYEHEVHGLDSVDSFNVALDHVIQAINIIKKDEHN